MKRLPADLKKRLAALEVDTTPSDAQVFMDKHIAAQIEMSHNHDIDEWSRFAESMQAELFEAVNDDSYGAPDYSKIEKPDWWYEKGGVFYGPI